MSKWNTLFHIDTFQKANRRYLFIHRNSIPTIKAVLIVETFCFKICSKMFQDWMVLVFCFLSLKAIKMNMENTMFNSNW